MSRSTRKPIDTTQTALPFENDGAEIILAPRFCKDPLNLLEFPVTLLGKRPFFGTLKFSDTIMRNGIEIKRDWAVSSSSEWGLPLSWDEQLMVVLLELTREHNFADRRIPFSRYDLVRRLNMPINQQSYNRISLGLDRLVGVTVKAENSFYERETKTYNSLTFHLLDKAYIHEEVRGNIASGCVRDHNTHVVWGEDLFMSMVKDHYYKDLDVNFFLSLQTGTSRRLFRYLDKQKYDGPNKQKDTFPHELTRLCHERMGISRSVQTISALKQQLDTAHQELHTRGFLRSMPEYSLMRKDRKTDPDTVKVVYAFGKPKFMIAMPRGKQTIVKQEDTLAEVFVLESEPKVVEILPAQTLLSEVHKLDDIQFARARADSDLAEEPREAMQWLLDNQLSRSTARELVTLHLDEVLRQREYLPFRDNVKDLAPYMRSCVLNGFGAPKRYIEEQARIEDRKKSAERKSVAQVQKESIKQHSVGVATLIREYLEELKDTDRKAYDLLLAEAWNKIPGALRTARVGESLQVSNVNQIVRARLGL